MTGRWNSRPDLLRNKRGKKPSRCLRCDLAYLCPSVKLASDGNGQTQPEEVAESVL